MHDQYPLLRGIELMPYHAMGVIKWERLGRPRQDSPWRPVDQATKDQWIDRLWALGCAKATIG